MNERQSEIVYSERFAHDITVNGRLRDVLDFWGEIWGKPVEAIPTEKGGLIIREERGGQKLPEQF